MSTDKPEGSSPKASAAGANSASGPQKKQRSLVERAIVWGAIGLLVAYAAVEASSRFAYDRTLTNLTQKFEELNADTTGADLALSEFEGSMLSGFPSRTESGGPESRDRSVVYRWWSLVHNYEITLKLGLDEPVVVITYTTPDAELPAPAPAGEASEEGDEVGAGGPPAPTPGGMPGGGGAPPGHGQAAAPGGGGGGPGGGNRGPRGLLGVLSRESVQAELKLTDEEKAALARLGTDFAESIPRPGRDASAEERTAFTASFNAAVEEQVAGILDEAQFTRAKQLWFREEGPDVLLRDDVAGALGLADEQKTKLTAIAASYDEERRGLFGKVFQGEIDRSEIPTRMAELRSQALEQAQAVLTDEQKQKWEELLGPPPAESPQSGT